MRVNKILYRRGAGHLGALTLAICAFALSACAPSKPVSVRADRIGTWDVRYIIENTQRYFIVFEIEIDADGVVENINTKPEKIQSLDDRLTVWDSRISGNDIRVRWTLDHQIEDDILYADWDYIFEGKFEKSKDQAIVLRGAVTGTEYNAQCVWQLENRAAMSMKEKAALCPAHKIKGTWVAQKIIADTDSKQRNSNHR